MRIIDEHHHTAEEVRSYLFQAQQICEAQCVGADERVTLLPVLVTLLSSRTIQYGIAGGMPGGAQLLG